jgi:hypothetical protein
VFQEPSSNDLWPLWINFRRRDASTAVSDDNASAVSIPRPPPIAIVGLRHLGLEFRRISLKAPECTVLPSGERH